MQFLLRQAVGEASFTSRDRSFKLAHVGGRWPQIPTGGTLETAHVGEN